MFYKQFRREKITKAPHKNVRGLVLLIDYFKTVLTTFLTSSFFISTVLVLSLTFLITSSATLVSSALSTTFLTSCLSTFLMIFSASFLISPIINSFCKRRCRLQVYYIKFEKILYRDVSPTVQKSQNITGLPLGSKKPH